MPLISDDTEVMIQALGQMGVNLTIKNSTLDVTGNDGKFAPGDITVDLHNAGTSTRFLTALAVLRPGITIITGNRRMQERPIDDLIDGLRQLGSRIDYLNTPGCPPVKIHPLALSDLENQSRLNIQVNGNKSSQYFSALLLLAPLLPLPLTLAVIGDLVSKPYIDTTIAVMKAFGVRVHNHEYRSFQITPKPYKCAAYKIEGDASAATYFHALKYLHGGKVEFNNLNTAKSIQGDAHFPPALRQLGKGSISMNAMPDAAMTLAVAAPFVTGTTRITEIANLRIKETDRLAALETEMKKLGVDVLAGPDSLIVRGQAGGIYRGGVIDTYNDHRMAMCFAVMGSKIPGIIVRHPQCTEKTYPAFWDDWELSYLNKNMTCKKHILLTGMRGSGKTFLGEQIARHTRRHFIDLDQMIQNDQGLAIAEIVKRHGWDYFRAVEARICAQAAANFHRGDEPLVIASGGGVILNPKNMKHLRRDATNIFIFVDPQALADRLQHTTDRPALTPGKTMIDELQDVWRERRDLYLKYADQVWDNTSGTVVHKHLKEIFAYSDPATDLTRQN